MRETSGQPTAAIASATRPPGAGGTARLTGAPGVLLSVAAICWVIATRRMSGMDMGVATRLGLFAFFSAVWVAMMAAMMLPGTVPAVLKRAQAGGMRTLPLFAGSYLGVWALPLALMIVGPGIWIVLAPSPVPGLTPPM